MTLFQLTILLGGSAGPGWAYLTSVDVAHAAVVTWLVSWMLAGPR